MFGRPTLMRLFGLLVLVEIGRSCYIRTCDLGILGKRTVEGKPALVSKDFLWHPPHTVLSIQVALVSV